MASIKKLKKIRERRTLRVRRKIYGTEERPRISVFRSTRHIYAQAIADDVGRTIAEASLIGKDVKGDLSGMKKTDAAREVGKLIGKKLLTKNINKAVFDRGPYLYHGRVKALAEGVREAGLTL